MQPAARVVVTFPGFDVEADPGASILRDAGAQIVLAPRIGASDPAEVSRLLAGATGAVVSTDPFDRSVLERLPELRIIARVGVGTDSIDLAAATQSGVLVSTTPGANEAVVAEHTLALMLAVMRRVTEHDGAVRAGRWDRIGPMTPGQLAGSTVGIIGFGAIGQGVAARLAGFGVEILVHDPFVEAPGAVTQVSLQELLRRSHLVSLHVPLSADTRGLIGTDEMALMRAGAVLINCARGGIVDEAALAAAIRSGRLGGAGIDVFAQEPPGDAELLTLPRVVVSPHVAGLSHASIAEMTRRACTAVATALAGELPVDAINPEALRRRR